MRYLQNKRLIELAVRTYGVETVVGSQPAPNYRYHLKYHVFRPKTVGLHTYPQYGYGGECGRN